MPTAYLLRTYRATHTQGLLVAVDEARNLIFSCVTLELPWLDNASGKSCIPEGAYPVRRRYSAKHADHYHVQDVPGRAYILFHPGNYTHQLLGCLLPGERFAHLDADAIPDILHTRATLNKMLATLGDAFTLHIFTAPVPGGTLPTAEVRP